MIPQEASSAVLVIGESLTDVLRADGHETRRPGGSPMNVACGLGLLDVAASLLTYLGRDADADQVLDRLRASSVELVEGSQSAERTGTAIATIDDSGAANYTFDVEWQLRAPAGLHITKWTHIGSIATFLSPGSDALELFVSTLAGRSRVSYDPNIRPQLLPDHSFAVKRFESFARMSDVVKLSDEDASWLYPGKSIDFALDRILSFGATLVVATAGSRGARLVTGRDDVTVRAREVAIVDTVGAGDSFMAALVAQMAVAENSSLDSVDLHAIGNVACVAAALTCSRAGSQPPSRAELMAAL